MGTVKWILIAATSLTSWVVTNFQGSDNGQRNLNPDDYYNYWWPTPPLAPPDDSADSNMTPAPTTSIIQRMVQRELAATETTSITKRMDLLRTVCSLNTTRCVKKKTERPCSWKMKTCPVGDCEWKFDSTRDCHVKCDGDMCSSGIITAAFSTQVIKLSCIGIKCDTQCTGTECIAECDGIGCTASCYGKSCIAKCTGKDCTAKCEGLDCVYMEFSCANFKGRTDMCSLSFLGDNKTECHGWFCEAKSNITATRTNSMKCIGQSCTSLCIGPNCTAECAGKTCQTKCIGEGCTSRCGDQPCEALCEGDNCLSTTLGRPQKIPNFNHPGSQSLCLGSQCKSECSGQSCVAKCDGFNCTVRCWGNLCDEEIFCNTDPNCFTTSTADITTSNNETTIEGNHTTTPPNTHNKEKNVTPLLAGYRVKLVQVWDGL